MFWAEAPSSFGQKKDVVETSTCKAQTVSLNSAQMQLAIDLQERSKIPSRNVLGPLSFTRREQTTTVRFSQIALTIGLVNSEVLNNHVSRGGLSGERGWRDRLLGSPLGSRRPLPKWFLRKKQPHDAYGDEEESEQRPPRPWSFWPKLKVLIGDPACEARHKKGQG